MNRGLQMSGVSGFRPTALGASRIWVFKGLGLGFRVLGLGFRDIGFQGFRCSRV